MAATARRLFAALLLAARPARAAFYSVSAAAGSLASPTALFAALSADATLAVDAALNTTCYADAAAERAAVAAVPAWDLVNGSAKGEPDAVHRLFVFSDFRTAALFMSQAALVFDRNDHHPVQTNVYNSVDVSLSTDDRKCLSTFDVATAGALDAIFARLQAAPRARPRTRAPRPCRPAPPSALPLLRSAAPRSSSAPTGTFSATAQLWRAATPLAAAAGTAQFSERARAAQAGWGAHALGAQVCTAACGAKFHARAAKRL